MLNNDEIPFKKEEKTQNECLKTSGQHTSSYTDNPKYNEIYKTKKGDAKFFYFVYSFP